MSVQTILSRAAAGGHVAVLLLGLVAVAGCDLEMEDSGSRFKQLNTQTSELIRILRQVKDEATANEHLAELQEVGAKIHDIQQRIMDYAASGKAGGAAVIANHRQASLWAQAAENVRNQLDWLRTQD
jgi:hypothetical protein